VVYLYKMGGRGDARPCARHGHSARRGVEAEKFHVSWDLRSAVSDPMSCVCVCYPIVWIAALSPLPPPGSAHGAHSRAYTQSESLSSVKMPRRFRIVNYRNAIALTGVCVVLGGGTIVPPCREAAKKALSWARGLQNSSGPLASLLGQTPSPSPLLSTFGYSS
jgi:hypothetical protein